MLDPSLIEQLQDHLARITEPVELVPALDDSPASAELDRLLEQLAVAGDRVSVVREPVPDGVRRPSFTIRRATDHAVAVRFAGIPLGHEFNSLVLAVLQVGGVPSPAPGDLQQRIRAIEGPLHFETFMSLSCANCPDVVQALNLMSVLNPGITHEAIDGARFPDEAERRGVLAVPTVFLNGEEFASGRLTLAEIVGRVDRANHTAEDVGVDTDEPFDVLVVGGGPAGATAAIYAARKGIRTGVVAERFGGQVLDTLSIENFVSVPRTEGPQLASALEAHVEDHDVVVMRGRRATQLVPAGADGSTIAVELEGGVRLRARTVVLATGARWRTLGVPGEDDYRNKGVTFCPHCDGPLFAGKRVAVIGGGNSGVEAAIDLAGIVEHVTLVEFDAELRADAVLQRTLRSLANVDVLTSTLTTEVLGDDRRVTGIMVTDRATGTSRRIDLDGVFVQIGLLPNTEWLDGVVERSERGEIVVDARGATSTPGVFAAGDCTTVPYKQIVIAMGAGATASLSAFVHLIRSAAPQPAAA
jgi:alkyl hydroperoxide reductase subunit F